MVFEVELVRTVTQRTTVNVEAMSLEDARNAGDCLGWYFAGDVSPEDWQYDGIAEGDTEAGDVEEAPPGEEPSYYWLDGQEVSEEEYREYEATEEKEVTAKG